LYVRTIFCMYEPYFVCTNHILYVRTIFCMYEPYFVCTNHISYVRTIFCMYEPYFVCTNHIPASERKCLILGCFLTRYIGKKKNYKVSRFKHRHHIGQYLLCEVHLVRRTFEKFSPFLSSGELLSLC